ncbi:putative phospholipid-transporting ATPase VA [Manis javanica]|nr:putative phospholipid-transporting ATPase VA [Manis javanica]
MRGKPQSPAKIGTEWVWPGGALGAQDPGRPSDLEGRNLSGQSSQRRTRGLRGFAQGRNLGGQEASWWTKAPKGFVVRNVSQR